MARQLLTLGLIFIFTEEYFYALYARNTYRNSDK